ncbi:lipase family protein [Azospirillum palustre]
MGSVSQYSATTANALLDLVDIAGGDLSQAYLPATLNLVTTFANGSVTSGGGQGLLATGTVAGIDGPVAVLAVGVNWATFISFFEQSFLTTTTTPPPYLKVGSNDSLIAQGYSLAYNAIHTQIWAAVAKLKLVPGYASNVPLLVVGMGPAGPLAQMAALDLRPGQTGPDGKGGSMASPVGAAGCYSFSTPAYGNASYATAVTAALGSVFLCNLNGIDFYPSIAGAPAGFAFSGAAQTLTASVPPSDVPWLERTPAFYQTAYGAAQPQLSHGGTVTPVPTGYSGDLAYTLALLTTAAYGRFQHPDLSQPLPSGYTRAADVVVGGVTWASIYTSLDRTVVASRGACSWIELLDFMGNGSLMPLPWFTSGGRILQGLSGFYPGYAAALFAALSGVAGVAGKPLVFAGHDFGGALAALAAYNLALVPHSGLPAAAAVYGFGTVRFGDYSFQGAYQSALGSVSYQLLRPNDVIAANQGLSLMAPLPTTMQLSGGMLSPVNSTTGHTLALYTSLLNPRISATAESFAMQSAAGPVAALPGNARRLGLLAATAAPRIVAATEPELTPFLSRMLEFHGLHPGHLAGPVLDTAAHQGRIVLSADPRVSTLAPAQVFAGGSRVFATNAILVRAGQALHIGSPGSQPFRLVAQSILLEPGATLSVESPAHLAVGSMASMAVSAAANPNIIVQGVNGTNGSPGYQGATGASGAPGYPGGNGGPGQSGAWGANGILPSSFTFSVGTISGTFVVRVIGGQGGDGGQGGAGGAGGNGGSGAAGGRGGQGGDGGRGGNGANGTAIIIRYDTMEPGTSVVFQDFGGLRGAGGASGTGGPGGAGQPPGTSGNPGNPGQQGQPGTPSTLQFVPSSS